MLTEKEQRLATQLLKDKLDDEFPSTSFIADPWRRFQYIQQAIEAAAEREIQQTIAQAAPILRHDRAGTGCG